MLAVYIPQLLATNNNSSEYLNLDSFYTQQYNSNKNIFLKATTSNDSEIVGNHPPSSTLPEIPFFTNNWILKVNFSPPFSLVIANNNEHWLYRDASQRKRMRPTSLLGRFEGGGRRQQGMVGA